MDKEILFPDYIFESSWEVCNKVGGIYTVLSTRALTLQTIMPDRIIFIGPDLKENNSDFSEDINLYVGWQKQAQKEGLNVRIGRWNVPGNPLTILVDFQPFFSRKNEIYTEFWETSQVDSLHAYGDYDEASMFSYAAAKTVESFYRYGLTAFSKII